MIYKTFKPLSNRVLIQKDATPEQSKGGIFIPDEAREKSDYGTVKALGTGARDEHGRLIAFYVEPGDRVLLRPQAGTKVTVNNVELLLVNEGDILAKVC